MKRAIKKIKKRKILVINSERDFFASIEKKMKQDGFELLDLFSHSHTNKKQAMGV